MFEKTWEEVNKAIENDDFENTVGLIQLHVRLCLDATIAFEELGAFLRRYIDFIGPASALLEKAKNEGNGDARIKIGLEALDKIDDAKKLLYQLERNLGAASSALSKISNKK